MSRVHVNAEVLRWAISRSGRPLDDLQHRLPNISKWIAGDSQPTLRQLEVLAKATRTPLGFFFLKDPLEEHLPIPHFRTLRDGPPSAPSPDLLETIQMMERRQAWMREFLIEQGQDRLSIVDSARIGENHTAVAAMIRAALHLDDSWATQEQSWTDALRILREAIESLGVLVVVNSVVGNNVHRTLDPKEFRGFVLVDNYVPLMFINSADSKAAQMFTLAHELAHVVFGSSAAFDLRDMQPADDPIEQTCNRVAAEFLVPEEQLLHVWPSIHRDPNPFQALARRFKVSELVTARRVLDLGLIQRKAFLAFYQRYLSKEREATRKTGGGDFYATQRLRVGRPFAETVIRAVREGQLLYYDAYRLTGLYGRSFDAFAASLGDESV